MSWQDILDVSLLRSGKITQAAIIGQDGDVWAESPGFNATRDERNAIVHGFEPPVHTMSFGGRRYTTTMACLDVILAKCTCKEGGCVVKKTDRSVLVAEYASTADAMVALALVERLADYLISRRY